VSPLTYLFAVAFLATGCSPGRTGEEPRAEYNPANGHLERLRFDANHNGRNDAVAIMDGARIVRIELDLDEDGQVERRDFYTPDGVLDRVERSGQGPVPVSAQAVRSDLAAAARAIGVEAVIPVKRPGGASR
jgi:hypothetical protein